jgi:predicted 2-oxoglutarate/Fe(II)-dependent dioxygenase YbiX
MDLRDAIIQIDGLFNKNLADRIVNYLDKTNLKNLGIAAGSNLDIRNVKGLQISNDETIFNRNNITDFVFLQLIHNEIFKMLPNYLVKFKALKLEKLIQVDLLKYDVGGKYEIHVDDFLLSTRSLTCIVNLNDNYKGGELSFFDTQKKNEILKLNLKKGSAVFFPSNFLYPHKINPILEGNRYSIVSWLA